MINPSELRIGNLLQGPPLCIPREGIYSDGVVAMTTYGIHMLDLLDGEDPYKPIPITTEWLERLGFKKTNQRLADRVLVFRAMSIQWNISLIVDDDGSVFYEVAPFQRYHIQHVHQLQNLVYALTGEELELKEK